MEKGKERARFSKKNLNNHPFAVLSFVWGKVVSMNINDLFLWYIQVREFWTEFLNSATTQEISKLTSGVESHEGLADQFVCLTPQSEAAATTTTEPTVSKQSVTIESLIREFHNALDLASETVTQSGQDAAQDVLWDNLVPLVSLIAAISLADYARLQANNSADITILEEALNDAITKVGELVVKTKNGRVGWRPAPRDSILILMDCTERTSNSLVEELDNFVNQKLAKDNNAVNVAHALLKVIIFARIGCFSTFLHSLCYLLHSPFAICPLSICRSYSAAL